MPNPVGGCTNGGERAVTDRGWRGLRRVVITSRLRWSNKAPIAERPRCETSILVRTIGMITTAKQAVAIVTEGKADMVALARAFLDNPHWGWHAAQALSADIARPVQYQRSAPKLWPGAALRG